MNSIGFALISLRSLIPQFFSVIIANTMIIISTYSILWAVYAFCGKKHSKRFDIILTSLFTVLFIIFTYAVPNISIRIIIISLLSAYIGIRITYSSLKEFKAKLNTRYFPLSGSSLLLSLTHIYRVIYYISANKHETSFLDSGSINGILLIINYCMIFLIYTSFIVLNSYRADMSSENPAVIWKHCRNFYRSAHTVIK